MQEAADPAAADAKPEEEQVAGIVIGQPVNEHRHEERRAAGVKQPAHQLRLELGLQHPDVGFLRISPGRGPAATGFGARFVRIERQLRHPAPSCNLRSMRTEGSKPSGRNRIIRISARPKIISFQLLNFNSGEFGNI